VIDYGLPFYCIDSNQILHNDKDYQVLFGGCPDVRTTNQRWRGHFDEKIEKLPSTVVISWRRFDLSPRNLALHVTHCMPLKMDFLRNTDGSRPPVIIAVSQQESVRSSRYLQWGTKVRRYNWHSAGSLGWPFPMLRC